MQVDLNSASSGSGKGRALRVILVDNDPPRMCRCLSTLTALGCEVLLITQLEELPEASKTFGPEIVFIAGAVARLAPADALTGARLPLAAKSVPVLTLPLAGPETSRQPVRKVRRTYVPPVNPLRRFTDLFAALAGTARVA